MRALVVAGLLVFSFALLGGVTYARNHNEGSRPGWGFGDDNHEHTGPPGQSTHPVFSVHPGNR